MPPKDAAGQAAGMPGAGTGGGDRLSLLPDEALIRILSHLKAWEAVRSCLLSKRWRGLWASARRLDIRQPCGCRGDLAADHRRAEAFAAFVKNLLLRRRNLQPLIALRLCWSHRTIDGDSNTWIAHAVRHGAEEIELSGKHHAVYPTPEHTSFIAGDAALKILKLIHVQLDDATLTHLCSRCTTLEELELTDCRIPAKTIQSTLLKRLTMIRCEIPSGLLVYAPNLVLLQCSRPSGYVPWIENLGSPGIVNSIIRHTPGGYPEYMDLVSCNLKILKLSHVHLDDVSLAKLCSRCTSLEGLELKDCSIEGKDIRSTSLKCLTMISCKFTVGFTVHAPNLVLLRCIRPFQYVPQIQNMEFIVAATIVLDDSCLLNDHQWPREEDDEDESDHDVDFFARDGAEDSDDNIFAHAGAKDSGDDKHDESDDTGNYYDSDWSGPSDEEDDNCTVGYSKIAEEFRHKPYKYLIHGNKHSVDHPRDNCGGKYGSSSSINFGGDGILCSISNVKTMELLAHPREMLLRRELESCTVFKNLKTLSAGEWCIAPNFDALATILNSSPNLENLFLHLDMAFDNRVDINPSGYSFTCTNLKMVKITCSNRDIMVHKLAEFFSDNSIPYEKIFVRRTASTGNVKGAAGFQSEAEKKAAKQGKAGN